MCWITRKRMMKEFSKSPDAFMTVNQIFCDHKFINGECPNCGISVDDWKKESPYNVVEG